MKKTLLAVTIAAAAAAATFSTQASANHDPVVGALVGGGIGAAVGGPPGAAIGAILGLAIGAESDHHRYGHRRYYGERPDYDHRYYDRAPRHERAPARYYEPAYEPRVYRASPRYAYEMPRANPNYERERGYDRRYEPRYDDRRYQEDRRYEPQYRYDERRYDDRYEAPRYYR